MRSLVFFTLHHVHDIPACYRAMAQMVKPGGRIVFLEPNPFNLLYYLQILFTPRMTWSGERGIPNMRKSLVFEAMHTAGGFYPGARRVQTGVETEWPPRPGQYDKGRAVLPTVLGVGLSRQSQIAGRMPGRVVGSDGASSGLCRRLPRNDQPVWVPIRGHHGNGWLTGKSVIFAKPPGVQNPCRPSRRTN